MVECICACSAFGVLLIVCLILAIIQAALTGNILAILFIVGCVILIALVVGIIIWKYRQKQNLRKNEQLNEMNARNQQQDLQRAQLDLENRRLEMQMQQQQQQLPQFKQQPFNPNNVFFSGNQQNGPQQQQPFVFVPMYAPNNIQQQQPQPPYPPPSYENNDNKF